MLAYSSDSNTTAAHTALALSATANQLPNSYALSLFDPINVCSTYPDGKPDPRSTKQIYFNASLTGSTNYMIQWNPHGKDVMKVFTSPTDGNWSFPTLIEPSQDLKTDFAQYRSISGLLELCSATIASGAMSIQGQAYAAKYSDTMDLPNLPSTKLVSYAATDVDVKSNVPLADGLVILAAPNATGDFIDPRSFYTYGRELVINTERRWSNSTGNTIPGATNFGTTFVSQTPGWINNGTLPAVNANVIVYDSNLDQGTGVQNSYIPYGTSGRVKCKLSISGDGNFTGIGALIASITVLDGNIASPTVLANQDIQTGSTVAGIFPTTLAIEFTINTLAPIGRIQVFVTTSTTSSLRMSLGSLTFTSYEVAVPGRISNGAVAMITGVSAGQVITVSGVVNYEVIPSFQLARNQKLTTGSGDPRDLFLANQLYLNRAGLGLRGVYTRSEYREFLSGLRLNSSVFQRENMERFSHTFSLGDLWSGLKSVGRVIAPSLVNAYVPSTFRPAVNYGLQRIGLAADGTSSPAYTDAYETNVAYTSTLEEDIESLDASEDENESFLVSFDRDFRDYYAHLSTLVCPCEGCKLYISNIAYIGQKTGNSAELLLDLYRVAYSTMGALLSDLETVEHKWPFTKDTLDAYLDSRLSLYEEQLKPAQKKHSDFGLACADQNGRIDPDYDDSMVPIEGYDLDLGHLRDITKIHITPNSFTLLLMLGRLVKRLDELKANQDAYTLIQRFGILYSKFRTTKELLSKPSEKISETASLEPDFAETKYKPIVVSVKPCDGGLQIAFTCSNGTAYTIVRNYADFDKFGESKEQVIAECKNLCPKIAFTADSEEMMKQFAQMASQFQTLLNMLPKEMKDSVAKNMISSLQRDSSGGAKKFEVYAGYFPGHVEENTVLSEQQLPRYIEKAARCILAGDKPMLTISSHTFYLNGAYCPAVTNGAPQMLTMVMTDRPFKHVYLTQKPMTYKEVNGVYLSGQFSDAHATFIGTLDTSKVTGKYISVVDDSSIVGNSSQGALWCLVNEYPAVFAISAQVEVLEAKKSKTPDVIFTPVGKVSEKAKLVDTFKMPILFGSADEFQFSFISESYRAMKDMKATVYYIRRPVDIAALVLARDPSQARRSVDTARKILSERPSMIEDDSVSALVAEMKELGVPSVMLEGAKGIKNQTSLRNMRVNFEQWKDARTGAAKKQGTQDFDATAGKALQMLEEMEEKGQLPDNFKGNYMDSLRKAKSQGKGPTNIIGNAVKYYEGHFKKQKGLQEHHSNLSRMTQKRIGSGYKNRQEVIELPEDD